MSKLDPTEFTPPTSLTELDNRTDVALATIRDSGWRSWADSAGKRYLEVRADAEKYLPNANDWLQNVEAVARMREGRTRGDQL